MDRELGETWDRVVADAAPRDHILQLNQDQEFLKAATDQRTEAELRRSESFLAEGQRLTETGSFSWKLATDEVTWSEQLYRIYGVEPGPPLTLKRINGRVHPEDRPLMNGLIARARAAVADFEHPHRLLMDDGSVKYLIAMARGTVDAEGRPEFLGAAPPAICSCAISLTNPVGARVERIFGLEARRYPPRRARFSTPARSLLGPSGTPAT